MYVTLGARGNPGIQTCSNTHVLKGYKSRHRPLEGVGNGVSKLLLLPVEGKIQRTPSIAQF